MANFHTDPRIINWPLVSAPISIIFISVLYLYIVYFAGLKFMKNRQPYSLKIFMQCYNLFQVIANAWVLFNIMTYGRPFSAVWKYCESLDKLCGNYSEKILEMIWWTLILKMIDLIDTIVFVLRKKDRQISFLHTYHHASTFIYVWLLLSYFNHSFNMTATSLNTFVHVVMYSYYFLSTFGLNTQRMLAPVKKWITILQMAHIAFVTVVSMQGLIPGCGTKIVKYYSILTFINGFINLLFFFNFFYHSYKKSKTV